MKHNIRFTYKTFRKPKFTKLYNTLKVGSRMPPLLHADI
jgi:hypothetical protein